MFRRIKFAFAIVIAIVVGCKTAPKNQLAFPISSEAGVADYLTESLRPQEANLEFPSEQQFDTGPLENFDFNDQSKFVRYSLNQCIETALRESKVLRELGGTVLLSPELMKTDEGPAITYTDPRSGEEAALSEFDAVFSNQLLYQNNDRAFNSSFIGDQGVLQQDLATNLTNLSKRSATGALFELNHQVVYDRNNTPANRFSNNTAYDTFLAAEFRQPLLQGGGVLFNRIAGPNNLPGINNGVLIARTNTDIALADFEIGIRNLVSDVENAYWDLYFAYRDLEAKIEARNGAFKIWESLKFQSDDKKATEILQAEEQYYLFASRVEDAIQGQLNDGTRTNNGSSGGTFRANAGVRTAERRLRLITGQVLNDSVLIVPQDMPSEAQVVFDWEQIKNDALTNRTELRRQRWALKREQLNCLANKNQLLPRLDLIGRYRVRGFGNDLFGSNGFDPEVAPGVDPQNDSDAYATFLNGDLQEWELGMDLNIPIGYRRQMAAVRNSELAYMREMKILNEQEREIIYGLSNSIGEMERTSSLLNINSRRLDASKRQYEAIQEDFENDDTTIDLVLESQRRVIDAKLDYFKSQVELMLAIKSVHFEKGTILTYHNVSLSEKGQNQNEIDQAYQRETNKSRVLNYFMPGLKTSRPLDQPQIGYRSSESVFMSENVEKKTEGVDGSEAMLFANEDPNPDVTTPGASEGSVLMQIADQITADELENSAETPEQADDLKEPVLSRFKQALSLRSKKQTEETRLPKSPSSFEPILPAAQDTDFSSQTTGIQERLGSSSDSANTPVAQNAFVPSGSLNSIPAGRSVATASANQSPTRSTLGENRQALFTVPNTPDQPVTQSGFTAGSGNAVQGSTRRSADAPNQSTSRNPILPLSNSSRNPRAQSNPRTPLSRGIKVKISSPVGTVITDSPNTIAMPPATHPVSFSDSTNPTADGVSGGDSSRISETPDRPQSSRRR